MSVAKWCVLILMSSTVVAMVVSKIVWGYWVSPPSVTDASDDDTLAASAIRFDSSGWTETALTLSAGSHASLPAEGSSACPEDRLTRGLRAAPPSLPASISSKLRRLATASIDSSPHESDYGESARRWQGVAVLKASHGERYVVFGRHTGEVANDRYFYVEDLYALEGKHLTPQRQVRFFFEVAGLEFFSFGAMWLILTVFGASVAGGFVIVRRLVP
jgi:hypothetical protein